MCVCVCIFLYSSIDSKEFHMFTWWNFMLSLKPIRMKKHFSRSKESYNLTKNACFKFKFKGFESIFSTLSDDVLELNTIFAKMVRFARGRSFSHGVAAQAKSRAFQLVLFSNNMNFSKLHLKINLSSVCLKQEERLEKTVPRNFNECSFERSEVNKSEMYAQMHVTTNSRIYIYTFVFANVCVFGIHWCTWKQYTIKQSLCARVLAIEIKTPFGSWILNRIFPSFALSLSWKIMAGIQPIRLPKQFFVEIGSSVVLVLKSWLI